MTDTPPTIDADTGAIVLQPAEGLPPQTTTLIADGFGQFYAQANELRAKAAAIVVTSPDDKEQIAAAREHRLALKSIRVAADKTRKTMKEDSLRLGRAIDGAYNILEHAIKPLEQYLEDQEKIAERLEAERIANLRASRLERLREADPDHIHAVDVATYFDDQFEKVVSDVRALREIRIEREQREQAERIERERKEAEERERVRLENEQLKAEREAAEAKLREVEAKATAERAKAEAAERAEREAREKAEREARELREAAERREREAAAERAAAEKAAAAAARKAARAPDKAKLLGFAQQVRLLIVPDATTDDGKRVASEIAAKVEGFAKWIEAQTETL